MLTNVVGLAAGDDGALVSEHAIFGGSETLKARSTADPPAIFVVRAKSFPAEESGGDTPEVVALAVPDTGATNAAAITERHVEERIGPNGEPR